MGIKFDETSHFQQVSFNENPNVGVFCRANDTVAFLQKALPRKIVKRIQNALDVHIVEMRISDANIIGSLVALNSHGAIVTDLIGQEDLKLISDQGYDICVINDVYNAAGNDILVNDHGALVHPDMHKDVVKAIEETLSVPVVLGTIAGLNTVGMTAVVTNKGLLCHPKVLDSEKQVLEDVFKVPVMIGTVNHGVPLIGSGLIANTKGAVVGSLTTGIEMGRIEEALGLILE
jgi:translation initiation factor 6